MKNIQFFFWGILSAFGSLMVIGVAEIASSVIFSKNSTFGSEIILYSFYFVAFSVLIEELFKYAMIQKIISTENERGFFDSIYPSFLVGVGFAATESFLIIMSTSTPALAGISSISIVHISTSLIIGFGSKVIGDKFFKKLILLVPLTFSLHLAYNLSALSSKDFIAYTVLGLLLAISVAILVYDNKSKMFA